MRDREMIRKNTRSAGTSSIPSPVLASKITSLKSPQTSRFFCSKIRARRSPTGMEGRPPRSSESKPRELRNLNRTDIELLQPSRCPALYFSPSSSVIEGKEEWGMTAGGVEKGRTQRTDRDEERFLGESGHTLICPLMGFSCLVPQFS